MSGSDIMKYFSKLTDEELMTRVATGSLTPDADSVARAELRARRLAVPKVAVQPDPVDEEYLGDWVILENKLTPTEAHLLCACLQSAGIQADAGDTNIVQANALIAIAVGGASVRVHGSQVAEAREVLAAFRRGDFELGEDFDPDAA
jgi:hypothetical protein